MYRKAGSDFNSSNVYAGGEGAAEVPVNVCVGTTTTMLVLKFSLQFSLGFYS